MSGPLHVSAGEVDADELLATLQAGRRVVVEVEVLDAPHEVTLRHDGELYYCDTPTTLHTHDSVEEMRECVVKQGYVST